MDGVDILSVDRSKSKAVVCTSGDDGVVKLFRYPVLQKGAKYVGVQGHSSHCAKACFNAQDNFLITIGAKDRTIIQWKIRF